MPLRPDSRLLVGENEAPERLLGGSCEASTAQIHECWSERTRLQAAQAQAETGPRMEPFLEPKGGPTTRGNSQKGLRRPSVRLYQLKAG